MGYEISHDVPPPPPLYYRDRNSKWRKFLSQMNPGDSVFVKTHNERMGFVNASRKLNKRVTSRIEKKGFRVWLVD